MQSGGWQTASSTPLPSVQWPSTTAHSKTGYPSLNGPNVTPGSGRISLLPTTSFGVRYTRVLANGEPAHPAAVAAGAIRLIWDVLPPHSASRPNDRAGDQEARTALATQGDLGRSHGRFLSRCLRQS